MRGRSAWGRAKETLIGLIWVMVTSGAVRPLTDTRLPGCNRIGPVLPSIGEWIWVNCRLRCAASALALACIYKDWLLSLVWAAMAFCFSRAAERSALVLAPASVATAPSYAAW